MTSTKLLSVLLLIVSAHLSARQTYAEDLSPFPLRWLAPGKLMVGEGSSLSIYDPTGELISKLYDLPVQKGEVDFNRSCFSSFPWKIQLNITEKISGGMTSTRFESIVVNKGDLSSALAANGISINQEGLPCGDKASSESPSRLAGEFGITLPEAFYPDRWEAAFDHGTGRYFVYRHTQNFKPGGFPVPGWWLDPVTKKSTRIELPAGPWVGEPGFLKTMSCFSCGCSCYSYMRVTSAGGRLLIRIWGQGVIDEGLGIFLLSSDPAKPGWTRLAKGETNSDLAVSQDGCTVAYLSSKLQIIDICK